MALKKSPRGGQQKKRIQNGADLQGGVVKRCLELRPFKKLPEKDQPSPDKAKAQWDITPCGSERLLLATLQTLSAGDAVKKRAPSSSSDPGNENV